MFVLAVFIFGLTLGAGGREFKSLRPTSKTPVQRLILEINKSRFWGSIRLGTVWGQLRKEDERFFEAISEHWGILGGILNLFSC